MAGQKDAVSFDEIIQAGRVQREKQKLADEIFGQGRRNNNNGSNGSRKPGTGPSLASRVGVTKAARRSGSKPPNSQPNIEAQWGHDLHSPNNPKGPRMTRPPRDNHMARTIKNELLYNSAVAQAPRNATPSTVTSRGFGEEISIRGTAGPYVVIGSNFAPGTTAADIESAMIPSGGEMQSCRIMSATPTVIAEMVFTEKQNAESADGRILHIYMKTGGPSPGPPITSIRKAPTSHIDLTHNGGPSYDDQREQSDRRRRAEPEFQDGSYGFENNEDKEDTMDVDIDAQAPPPAPAPVPVTAPTPAAPAPANVSAPRTDRRDDRRDDRREDRRGYEAPRDYGRGRSYYDRDRDSGRPRNDQRLYSDDMYSRPRGRGFR
ncbi:hypothetical protein P7C71_g3382, partial [Lecanoromycetidae sp. Uapishka_2]